MALLMGLKSVSPADLNRLVREGKVAVFDVNSRQSWSKAPIAAKRAKRMGYEDVRVLSAGITGWVAAGLPTQAG